VCALLAWHCSRQAGAGDDLDGYRLGRKGELQGDTVAFHLQLEAVLLNLGIDSWSRIE